MLRGTPISQKPIAVGQIPPPRIGEPVAAPVFVDRLLNTAEANDFLRRKKGFLEKRRSSGIDSPTYIQRRKGAAVTYRTSDLLAWEEKHMCTASSDHDDSGRRTA